jgi:hypothetical protein
MPVELRAVVQVEKQPQALDGRKNLLRLRNCLGALRALRELRCRVWPREILPVSKRVAKTASVNVLGAPAADPDQPSLPQNLRRSYINAAALSSTHSRLNTSLLLCCFPMCSLQWAADRARQ